ncbi:hypothetical protein HK100_005476 [Physocladia obscura]|uniref:Uncharacterized protein n=1 Tax=Physocladia obscura TaxID=109957 RepID=A0AAD5T6U0_9FUNG|nr:hypothetical protein HK100_005476 [Physocladia obscura]
MTPQQQNTFQQPQQDEKIRGATSMTSAESAASTVSAQIAFANLTLGQESPMAGFIAQNTRKSVLSSNSSSPNDLTQLLPCFVNPFEQLQPQQQIISHNSLCIETPIVPSQMPVQQQQQRYAYLHNQIYPASFTNMSQVFMMPQQNNQPQQNHQVSIIASNNVLKKRALVISTDAEFQRMVITELCALYIDCKVLENMQQFKQQYSNNGSIAYTTAGNSKYHYDVVIIDFDMILVDESGKKWGIEDAFKPIVANRGDNSKYIGISSKNYVNIDAVLPKGVAISMFEKPLHHGVLKNVTRTALGLYI